MNSPKLASPGLVTLSTAVIGGLNDCRSIKALWAVVYRVIRLTLPYHSLSFYFNYLSPGPAFRVFHGQPVPGSLVPWLVRRRLSPAPAFLRRHPRIKIYRLRHLFPDAQTLFNSDYYTQVMRVEGWHSKLGLGFWKVNELVALLVFRRTPEQGEFSAHEVNFLEQLHPHVFRALRRIQSYESAAVLQSGLSTCLDALGIGVMMFDWNLQIAFKNQAAETLCVECAFGAERARQLNIKRSFTIPRAVEEALRVAAQMGAVLAKLRIESRIKLARLFH